MSESCGSCRFWKLTEPDVDGGYCRRFPPTVSADDKHLPNSEIGADRFPITMDTDWCGEYAEESANEAHKQTVKSDNIADLKLSTRAVRCLMDLSIYTIQQLVEIEPWQLMGAKGIGSTSILEIEKALYNIGLHLKGCGGEPKGRSINTLKRRWWAHLKQMEDTTNA